MSCQSFKKTHPDDVTENILLITSVEDFIIIIITGVSICDDHQSFLSF